MNCRLDDTWPGPPAGAPTAMAHTDLEVTRTGEVICGDAAEPELLQLDLDGTVVRRTPLTDVTEPHGLTLVEEDGAEALWIADTGVKYYAAGSTLVGRRGPSGGQVVQVDLAGRRLRALPPPPALAPPAPAYAPTTVVVDELRLGGSGAIWVADGYGGGLVHRYDAEGNHLAVLGGSEQAGPLDEPHGLMIDRRGPEPLLYVTDRRNGRIQVFDLENRFVRTFGAGGLIGPTCMTTSGKRLIVTDVIGRRLSVFDRDDRFLGHVLAHPEPFTWPELVEVAERTGWPNAFTSAGEVVVPHPRAGVLNSPHSIAADEKGGVYVNEFVLGGRVVKLTLDA
jgi:hypothetical protein